MRSQNFGYVMASLQTWVEAFWLYLSFSREEIGSSCMEKETMSSNGGKEGVFELEA